MKYYFWEHALDPIPEKARGILTGVTGTILLALIFYLAWKCGYSTGGKATFTMFYKCFNLNRKKQRSSAPSIRCVSPTSS